METALRRRRFEGPRLYVWAMAGLFTAGDQPDSDRWVLTRRSITEPEGLAFYLCAGPAATTIGILVRVARTRWAIEECFQQAKTETGRDHYQVRRYQPWYRHITLAMC